MIKSLQKRFILTAMIAVTVLLVLLLGGVAAVNAWSGNQEQKQLLSSLVAMEVQDRPEGPPREEEFRPDPGSAEARPAEDLPPAAGPEGRAPRGFLTVPPSENDRMRAVFFVVTVRDGVPVSADVSRISTVREKEALACAASVLQRGSREGTLDSYLYAGADRAGGEAVYVFLDRTAQRNAMVRVTALAGLAGVAGWLLMLVLVVFLSRRAIRPIAENMERQRQFVTDAGHELKTPLSIIQANAEALELVSGETKYSRNIRAQATRLTELTGNLLTMARSEELLDHRSLLPLDLSALAEQSIASFAPSIEHKKVKLSSDLRNGVCVLGDRAQLTTLMSILIDNAVKYCPEGGSIAVSLAGTDKVRLRMENDCAALPDCPAERLFDRFYRGDAARTQRTGGFGIGLSSARSIAKQHKGSLTAEYLGPTRIAFLLTLPAHGNPQETR